MSTAGVIIRLAIFVSFLALLFFAQRFWFLSLWRVSEGVRRGLRIAIRVVAASLLVLMIVFFVSHLARLGFIPRSRPFATFVAVLQLWLISSTFAYLLFKIVRALGWGWRRTAGRILSRAERMNPSRRDFFRHAAHFAAAIPLVAAVYGFSTERFRFRVRRVEVPIDNLPQAFDGFRIVQLSDIHIGDFMPRSEVRRAVDIANTLGAHVAFATGDYITGENDPLEACIAELSQLKTPLGTYGCNGNHEIYAEAEDEAERLFQKYGMTMLRQRRTELNWQGAKLNLIGVDYQRDHMVRGPARPMLEGIEPLVSREMPNILLSHNPNSFPKAAALGIELSLAGHTHGGQVKVEIVDRQINPARFITEYIAGLYHRSFENPAAASNQEGGRRRAFLYVNRGIGTIGIPARLGVDPEITLLTLRRA